MNLINFIRCVAVLGFTILAGYIWWASSIPFWESVDIITGNRWGQVTLVDLYLGFVLSALVILVFEKSWIARTLWAAPIFFLGNVWTALWFVWRAPVLVARLRA